MEFHASQFTHLLGAGRFQIKKSKHFFLSVFFSCNFILFCIQFYYYYYYHYYYYYYYYYYHNYNKILKSDWLSTALISALIGQFNRTVRAITRALKWKNLELLLF